jgi:hypothetical protein
MYALEAQDIKKLKLMRFEGEAAHPDRDPAILIY